MAGVRPGEGIGGAGKFMLLPEKYSNFFLHYDLKAMAATLTERSDLPFEERFAAISKVCSIASRSYLSSLLLFLSDFKLWFIRFDRRVGGEATCCYYSGFPSLIGMVGEDGASTALATSAPMRQR